MHRRFSFVISAALVAAMAAGVAFAQAPKAKPAPKAQGKAAAAVKPGTYAQFETSMGNFTVRLWPDKAPQTVANFVGLARGVRPWKDPKTGEWVKKPMYDGTVFHRVIPEFMIQGGDPKGTGTGDPGYEFADEFDPSLQMDKGGILAMANRGPGTNGSQFFITEKATPWLNGKHTIFGQCTPLELEMKIARVPTGARNMPNDPVTIKKVTITRGAAKKAGGKKEKAAKAEAPSE
jgi:peptidyl-prolyl cis-trans isomerase A (cyclophilin A)